MKRSMGRGLSSRRVHMVENLLLDALGNNLHRLLLDFAIGGQLAVFVFEGLSAQLVICCLLMCLLVNCSLASIESYFTA
jgi:hypothetical protein